MVAASTANAASGTPSGGGASAPSVSSALPARNDGRSSSDVSEEEEVEWQPPGSKEVSQNSEAQDRAPSLSSKPSGPVSDNPPPDTEVGKTTGPQAISVDRANALQTLGPSDLTVRVVGVPATEIHNDGRNFLRDGFGGLEALVQMESLGATALAVLYDFFDDNDVIGDFILTPRETSLTATELSRQLKNFAVKRELASILSQFDSKQLALLTFGTVSLLRKVAAKYDRIKRKLAEDDGGASVIELQDEVLRLKRDQQFQSSYWIEKVAEVQRERNAAVAQMRSDFVMLMEERERDVSSLRNQVQTLRGELETARASRKGPASRSQGPRLRTAHVMNFLQEHATVMMHWPRLRDLLDHLESRTQVPPEWQTVSTIMANDNLASQAPPFVRMDPPQDEDDEETKESGPPAPDSFLDLSRGASTTKFRSKSSQLGKRAWLPIAEVQQEASSRWRPRVSNSGKSGGLPSRLEGPSSGRQAHDGRQVGVSGCSGADRGRQVPPLKLPSRRPYHHAPVHDALASFGFRSVDEVRPPPVLHGGFGGSGRSPPNGDPPFGVANDGVDDEDEIPDDASDDGVLNVAQRTTKRRRLSQSFAEVSTPKKIKTKSPDQGRVVRQVQVGIRIVEEAAAEVRRFQTPKRKHRYCSCDQGPQHLDAEGCRVIASPGLGITSWMYFGVRMKPGDPTAHAPFQTQGFPDFVPNSHDLDILKERCDGEELKAFLATRPWTKLSDTRRTEFFFHRRADLGHEVVWALEDWVDFMDENVEALWYATHWVVLDRDATSKFTRKTSFRRLKLHESVRKKVIAREKQLKKFAPASVWNEPRLWKFPKRICYWVPTSRSHTKPGTNANYSLKEQVELLDAREPACLQWGACSSDEERIAHLPEDVRRQLIPSGQRDYLDD
ncbi:unnamed protein product [Phytophthora fragariaefolia]|uniref:Unnamed protein product n=1 Tax=Phytophthora fragariaefolia TaxID=1490495 RepID=A0A9W6Y4H6_9STRA|nr:unnamed protein product [Phytophthora fragariaefolia]